MKPCVTCKLSALCKAVGYERAVFTAASARFKRTTLQMGVLYGFEREVVPYACPEESGFFPAPADERTYVDESAVFRGEAV